MGDIRVDIFLETLKELITNSKLLLIIGEEHQLQSLEMEIKYLREFLKVTEKKRNEHIEVMNLVSQIRDVVFESKSTVELFVSCAYRQDDLFLILESVKKEIKTLTAEVKQMYDENMYDINGTTVKNLKHSFTGGSSGSGKKHQLQSLEMKIKYLREFLEDTVKKRREHPKVMKLVMRIRDVVSKAENTIELFESRAYKQDDLYLDLKFVKKKIEILKAKVKQMYDENMYDINGTTVKELKHSFTGSSGSGGRNTSKVVEEMTPVGFKDEVETLLGKLHDSGEGGQLEIISIIGVGGGGKTTLAREVYNCPLTSQKFEICAWANISQDYHKTMKRNLLISILESASPGKHEGSGNSSEEDMLGEKLHKCLKGRKYLIVMDDIWDIEAWNDIQRSFPREYMGSKVLFTSRLPVQPASVPCVSHCLKPLPNSCSWEILQKKVFGKKQCPPELVDIGNQIAEKCQGLPLAVVTIAGILAMEDKTLDVWEKVAKNLCSIIAKNQEGCMEILELSYNHLPLHLKACFLYIGGHHEDSEIPVRELIWLWIAEGFIQQSDEGKSLEAIAQNYLVDLIDRSLVMVARKSKSHGGIKVCHIHDLLRELCLKKGEEDNFLVKKGEEDNFLLKYREHREHRRFSVGSCLCHIYDLLRELCLKKGEEDNFLVKKGEEDNFLLKYREHREHRRFSVGSYFFSSSRSPCELSPVQSFNLARRNLVGFSWPKSSRYSPLDPDIALLDSQHSWFVQDLPFIVENFDLLRVLHLISSEYGITFSRTSIETERRRLEDLVHLRYFALSLPVEKRPLAQDSFPYLPNLETLNVKASNYGEKISLPRHIVKMVKLRHLYTKGGRFGYHHVSNDEEDEGNMMDSLQTLHRMCACEDCLRLLERTPNLRKLGLWGSYILADLEFLKCLEILYVEDASINGLKLPSTLTRLTLQYTRLKWEELSIILQTLPSLEVLKLLKEACEGSVWNTSELEEGFSQLKYLKFKFLDIVEWSVSEDQFPGLEVLEIKKCRKLERIPIDFANLNELREITIRGSCVSAWESAREIQKKQRNRRGDDDCLNIYLLE